MQQKAIERWILFTRASLYLNTALTIGKILLGLYSLSIFLFINALYSAGLALAKWTALKGYGEGKRPADETHPHGYGRTEYRCYSRVGLILSASALVYVVYSLRMFLGGAAVQYPMVVALGIAAVTFSEIGLAIYGSVIARKSREPVIAATKMASLASALISLVLTQTAILSFAQEGDVTFYNGLAGILFGAIAVLIGVYMVVKMSLVIRGRHFHSLNRKIKRLVRKNKLDVQVVPLRLEDHGARARHLYVRVDGAGHARDLEKATELIGRRCQVTLYRQPPE